MQATGAEALQTRFCSLSGVADGIEQQSVIEETARRTVVISGSESDRA